MRSQVVAAVASSPAPRSARSVSRSLASVCGQSADRMPPPLKRARASASAFAYPRQRLLGLVLLARAVRFTIIGLLAIRFGPDVLRIARAPETTWIMLGFIVLCAVGSAFQVLQWVRRSRKAA